MSIGPKVFASSLQAVEGRGGGRLIDDVAAACSRLAPKGWAQLLAQHGLDIAAGDLASELARPLPGIDRTAPGFEDFAFEGTRGIEPGWPARSLLFHAFASPQVVSWGRGGDVVPLDDFPTPAEIEAVENYVYGAVPPSVEDLRARAGGAHLAIVVFAGEYRPAIGTVRRRHADMCYSRTGVARVGTKEPKYLPRSRGYMPFYEVKGVQAMGEGDPIRVVPCRYAAYIAALVPGRRDAHGPMRFLDPRPAAGATDTGAARDAGLAVPAAALEDRATGDAARSFWVPLHKLFDGGECIRDRTIEVRLSASHINEKLRRAHLFFASEGHNGGWTEPSISEDPFVITTGIAELSSDPDIGSWVLVPQTRARLVEPAEYQGRPLTFLVPETLTPDNPWQAFSSSLNLVPDESGARRAPEYLHARHVVGDDGQEQDLNRAPGVGARVRKGGYRARHYLDFTGDGWIDVECTELALDIPRRLAAYSLVASPDFFPSVNQSDLMVWTDQSVPPSLLETIWPESPGKPEALSDQRYAANLQLAGAGFDRNDDTMTAIVGHLGSGAGQLTTINRPVNRRESMLPDGAAGVFAPGWDVSYDQQAAADDQSSPVTFLNTYGLGSPFPEDAKLCAALSSFWPAVAPDVTRTFAPSRRYATATPLTDDVIGIDRDRSWDGMEPPRADRAAKVVEYVSLAYGDYVQASLDNRFSVDLIGDTTVEEYVARTLTMAMVYEAIGASTTAEKVKWSILSFRRSAAGDGDLQQALTVTGRRLHPEWTFRYEVFKHDNVSRPSPDPERFDKVLVDFQEVVLLFADPSVVLRRGGDGSWATHELRR